MPFTSYKEISQVLKEYEITSIEDSFIVEIAMDIHPRFREDIELTIKELTFNQVESVACEMIIFPFLREVYRNYRHKFTLWSHRPISYNEKLSGIPDYIIAQKSPLGKQVFDQPFGVVVEAKKDDFVLGWGQCLAQMLAAQKINDLPANISTFGIVTNAKLWEFGKLVGQTFTQEIKSYTFSDMDKLLGALNYVFHQCELVVADLGSVERL